MGVIDTIGIGAILVIGFWLVYGKLDKIISILEQIRDKEK